MKQKHNIKRNLNLFGEINEQSSNNIIIDLLELDSKNHEPIIIRINSGGGELPSTLSVVDTIRFIKSKVITYITGRACSGAGFISISGNERWISKNSTWGGHPITYDINDYTNILEDRMILKEIQMKLMFGILKKYTNLLKSDFEKIRTGELWLDSKQALKKGVVDKII